MMAGMQKVTKCVEMQMQKLGETQEDMKALNEGTDRALGVIFGRLQKINANLATGVGVAPPAPMENPKLEALVVANIQLRTIVNSTATEMHEMRKKNGGN